MWNALLNAAGAVGNAIDLPGSSVRDALAGRNPLDQWATPLTDKNRTSGRDLLRVRGLAGSKDTWGNFAGGMLTEAALDPLNFIPGMSVAKAAKAKGVAQAANRGIDAANATSMSQRAAGFMPEETIQHLHPSVLGPDRMPKTFYHGAPDISFEKHDLTYDNGKNLYGRGIYSSDSTRPTGHPDYGYWKKGMDSKMRYELPDSARPDFEEAIRSSQRDDIRRSVREVRRVMAGDTEKLLPTPPGLGLGATHMTQKEMQDVINYHRSTPTTHGDRTIASLEPLIQTNHQKINSIKDGLFNDFEHRHDLQDFNIDNAYDALQHPIQKADRMIPARARGYLATVLPPAGVKKHFVDMRNPLDIDNPAAAFTPPPPVALTRSSISRNKNDSRYYQGKAAEIREDEKRNIRHLVSLSRRSRDELDEFSKEVKIHNDLQASNGSIPNVDDVHYISERLKKLQSYVSYHDAEITKAFEGRGDSYRKKLMRSYEDRASNARTMAIREFKDRHTRVPISGESVWQNTTNDALAKQGYDGITHEGGKNFLAPPGVDPRHKVAIAFKPEQMYLPYIAKSIQQPLPVQKITPAMMRLAMYNAAARTAAQSGRTK